jgi:hypothetical protein
MMFCKPFDCAGEAPVIEGKGGRGRLSQKCTVKFIRLMKRGVNAPEMNESNPGNELMQTSFV